jgi:class 3 adenylate cyclase
MAKLDSRKRTQLPDSAFAYIDARGRRRLPINDAAHVRNALSRFNQVTFEDEAERDRARARLLRAAARHGIVPIGFMVGQLRASGPRSLPTGAVTLLFTDIEGSTALLDQLGDAYATLLTDMRRHMRAATRRAGGREVDARADEYFAAFANASDAIAAALAIQERLRSHRWPGDVTVLVRAAVHSGRPTLTDAGYVGMAVHAVARICGMAHGGQILVSQATMRSLGANLPSGISVREIGEHRLRGVPEPERLYELSARPQASRA